MPARIIRALVVKLLLEPSADETVTLQLSGENPMAIAFTAVCSPDGKEVSFARGWTKSSTPFLPEAARMSSPAMESHYRDSAAALAIVHPGTVIAIGAETGGRVFLTSAKVAEGTLVFSVGEDFLRTFRLAAESAATLQLLLSKSFHEAAYALLKSMESPETPDAAASAHRPSDLVAR